MEAWKRKYTCLRELKRYDEAKEYLYKAERFERISQKKLLNMGYKEWYNKGLEYINNNENIVNREYDKAIDCFVKSLEINSMDIGLVE